MHHPTDRITHTTAFVTPVVEHWLEVVAKDSEPLSNCFKGRKEMFYLTTHSTHFNLRLYGVRYVLKYHSDSDYTSCHHMGYSFRLTAGVLLYASFHREGNTYHSLCYTSCGALAGSCGTNPASYLTTLMKQDKTM